MKRATAVLLVIFFAATILSYGAPGINVPAPVKDSFAKLYPDIKKVGWSKENQNYEANFKQNGTEMSLVIDINGKVLETETSITKSQLSKVIRDYIKANCKGFKITEAAKIVDDKGNIKFEAEITKGKLKKDLIFDSAGNLLKGK